MLCVALVSICINKKLFIGTKIFSLYSSYEAFLGLYLSTTPHCIPYLILGWESYPANLVNHLEIAEIKLLTLRLQIRQQRLEFYLRMSIVNDQAVYLRKFILKHTELYITFILFLCLWRNSLMASNCSFRFLL